MKISRSLAAFSLIVLFCSGFVFSQANAAARELGSSTAKNGFKNEDQIRDKFNNWRLDEDARRWLAAMGYDVSTVENVTVGKPHGAKADVEIRVRVLGIEKTEGISIKLVSSTTGFNQIDKRWLATYAKMWKMPTEVVNALKLFVGETPPVGPQAASLRVNPSKDGQLHGEARKANSRAGSLRSDKRMYLTELDPTLQKAVVDFFTANKDEIVSDLFQGDGSHAASWVMVAYKATDKPRWVIRSSADTIKFYAEGKVEITRAGNLRIGRVTMQRKGGDGGRETAKQLQFKINPVQLFEAK